MENRWEQGQKQGDHLRGCDDSPVTDDGAWPGGDSGGRRVLVMIWGGTNRTSWQVNIGPDRRLRHLKCEADVLCGEGHWASGTRVFLILLDPSFRFPSPESARNRLIMSPASEGPSPPAK